ncbi:hypothetical protein DXG01_011555 [Tephrocybe rancida]|nr:hypothetical protein DXG01_011555 [Tephrocybe rancida]
MFHASRISLLRSARLSQQASRSLATGAHIDPQPTRTRLPVPPYKAAELPKPSPALRKDVYQLPVNNEEVARLNNQHVLLKMLIGGNYTLPIQEHLAHQPGKEKTIFDLGCGTGAWLPRATDMATDFPHCNVIGADVAPMDLGLALKNLRIDTCDANKGLLAYQNNQFDLANARMIAMGEIFLTLGEIETSDAPAGITNYPSLIGEFARVLKPGGFLQLQEWDFFVVDGNKRRIIGTESWFGRWCKALRHGLAFRGAGVNAAEGLDDMIRAQGFGSIQQQDVWMPIGPCFPKDTVDGMRLNLVGEFMRENVKAFIKGGRTLIVGSGMDTEEYMQLAYEATKEVQDVTHPKYLRLHCVTARK